MVNWREDFASHASGRTIEDITYNFTDLNNLLVMSRCNINSNEGPDRSILNRSFSLLYDAIWSTVECIIYGKGDKDRIIGKFDELIEYIKVINTSPSNRNIKIDDYVISEEILDLIRDIKMDIAACLQKFDFFIRTGDKGGNDEFSGSDD